MAQALAATGADLPPRLYARLCGRDLGVNLFHFQFLPAFYARRDILRDAPLVRGRVLDLGCGNQPYRPFLPPGVEYVGLDYPPTRAGMKPTVQPGVFGDGRSLPFAAATFDTVLCFQVLEHVDQPEAVIREIARVLKPQGILLLSVPFCYNLHLEPYDYFRFSPYGIKSLLTRQDLTVRQLRGQGGLGTLMVQMFHNWLFSGLARQARRRRWLRPGLALLLPLLLLLTACNNLVGLGLDRLNRHDLRFSPNLWLVAEKV